ncbi:class I SAM-dependent DNA methyltransferase [Hymenobacter sp. BT523]|uniref:class I SAM-dependent DNA methyltransferase n=1 Tax=Hymenobacter sp. BT523 TaxID=2795725 RepID=UPI0018ED58C2|nr:class I SAM-dependent DNA methyltransferase [Hymenobacter sp. BT523]MBJ6109268.1 class I SAM-dependent DNA methyltransferase [Hymenobacter sp. BT523]
MPLPFPAPPYLPDDPASFEAAERLGQLHDGLRATGFGELPAQERAFEELLVRVAFCCFAEDNGLFENNQFRHLLEAHTRPDGADTAALLHELFQVLSLPVAQRPAQLPPWLATLPCLGEALFGEALPLPAFTAELRERLLACTRCAWERISPTVFGSLFLTVDDPNKRQWLDARYTPDVHIFKLIGPLFLDELHQELARAGHDAARLDALHQRLSTIKLFDPACSGGNVLVVAYRELRLLELAVLQARFGKAPGEKQSRPEVVPRVTLSQCAGLALETFPSRVAALALWMADHLLNRQFAAALGQPPVRRPLAESAHILCHFELTAGWETTFPGLDYILSNLLHSGDVSPKYWHPDRPTSAEPRYVGGTNFQQLARYLQHAPHVRAAFVLAKKDLQGPYRAAEWRELQQDYNLSILFAHRSFAWKVLPGGHGHGSNVVVGLGKATGQPRQLFAYDTPLSEPRLQLVPHINHYLLAAPDAWFGPRPEPLAPVPRLAEGHSPFDGGHTMLSEEQRHALLAREPAAAPYVHPFLSSIFYRHPMRLWCVRLAEVPAHALPELPRLRKMRDAVLAYRQNSAFSFGTADASTHDWSENEAPVATGFIALAPGIRPEVEHLAAALLPSGTMVASGVAYIAPATPYLFGLIISAMFGAWVRQLCDTWKYGYRNDGALTYYHFPFPVAPTSAQVAAVEAAVAAVLAAPKSHAAQIPVHGYWHDDLTPELAAAVAHLDAAVERCFRPEPFATEQERLEFLFAAYHERVAEEGAAGQ